MTFICNIDDIPEVEESANLTFSGNRDANPQCFETEIEIDGQKKPVFLLRNGSEIKAYINSCPHTGAKLNWQPGIFLDSEKYFIQCSIHGALFEKESGLCVHGPCAKQYLSRVEIRQEDGMVCLNG